LGLVLTFYFNNIVLIFDGFDTGLIVSNDAEQDLAPMYISDLVRIIRILSELIGLFRHEESLPALSFLTFPFLVNSNLTLMNMKIEDAQ
jgi:hypothetical protein